MNNNRILGLEALARHCENLLATEKIKKKLEEDFVAGRRNGDDLTLRRRMFSRMRAWLGTRAAWYPSAFQDFRPILEAKSKVIHSKYGDRINYKEPTGWLLNDCVGPFHPMEDRENPYSFEHWCTGFRFHKDRKTEITFAECEPLSFRAKNLTMSAYEPGIVSGFRLKLDIRCNLSGHYTVPAYYLKMSNEDVWKFLRHEFTHVYISVAGGGEFVYEMHSSLKKMKSCKWLFTRDPYKKVIGYQSVVSQLSQPFLWERKQ
jgi:hypothetical protein